MKKFIVILTVALAMILLTFYIGTVNSTVINGVGTNDEIGVELNEEIDGIKDSIHKIQYLIIAIIASMILYSFFLLTGSFLIIRKREAKIINTIPDREQIKAPECFAKNAVESDATKTDDIYTAEYISDDEADTDDFIAHEDDTLQQSYFQQYEVTGKLFAEALMDVTGADIAFINSGSIRGSLDPDNITENDTILAFPFRDTVTVQGLTKAQIKAVLEHSAKSFPENDSRSLYVYGLDVELDASMPIGERVVLVTSSIGAPLDDESEYIVAVNDYISNGGDGYEMLAGLPRISEGRTVVQAVLELREKQNAKVLVY